MTACVNNLMVKAGAGQLCRALGIRLCQNPLVVQLGKNAGFDSLFIDLEHSTLSLDDASQLCSAGLLAGITPFVRVPYQCGNGFIQRVLDGGAMGIVFPHIHSASDAKDAVSICKYPPVGSRSMTGQLPFFSFKKTPHDTVIQESNTSASSVILMIETKDALDRIDEIAAVDGVDVLLVGTNDLAIELGVPGDFQSPVFTAALELVSHACRRHAKIMGMAGIYDDFEIQNWAINTLNVRFLLCQQDSGLIAGAAANCLAALPQVVSTSQSRSN